MLSTIQVSDSLYPPVRSGIAQARLNAVKYPELDLKTFFEISIAPSGQFFIFFNPVDFIGFDASRGLYAIGRGDLD
jgi:hypothetical protein